MDLEMAKNYSMDGPENREKLEWLRKAYPNCKITVPTEHANICWLTLPLAQSRVSRAASNGEFFTNGKKGRERRIAKNSFSTWRLKQRDKDLDKEP
jgi:hypothetical protein